MAAALAAPARSAALDKVEYNRDVRPILSENCFYCHGQDPNHRKADLRLDLRDVAVKAKAIVPGKPDESELVSRILSSDADEQMPPLDSHRRLTAAQKDTLKRWIGEGAEYQQHWAYVAPVRPANPAVKRRDWGRNPIDAFVLVRLEANSLSPSPEADRGTLLRRVTIDLTGLPPSEAEVDAFLADKSAGAYERVVDRLLASPAYGERMAMPWLDAARYADSNGFQQDGDTDQWVWRDWVVKALNDDMPFDRFSIEQLAGDLLPKAALEQKIASGFNRNHMLNGEGGAIPEEQRFNALFDRVDTTATNWLGLTMACAQCHDHKYDPITQRDYYSFLAAFNNVPESGIAPGSNSRLRIASPLVAMPVDATDKRLAAMKEKLRELETETHIKEKIDGAFAAWRKKLGSDGNGLPMSLANLLEMPERSEKQEDELTHRLREYFETKVWPETAKNDKQAQRVVKYTREVNRYANEATPRVMIMSDAKPRTTRILERGNYETPTVAVTFATPAFLPPPPADAPKNRLGLALAVPAQSSVDRPRASQPPVADVLRNRAGENARGLRRAERNAGPARPDRLAGGRVSRPGMPRTGRRQGPRAVVDEARRAAHRHQRDLPPKFARHAGAAGARPGEPFAGAGVALSLAVDGSPRHRAFCQRADRFADRRPARLSVSAARDLGDVGDH